MSAQVITGLTAQGARYAEIHPAFAAAFTFLNSTEPANLPVGSHDREGFSAVVIETFGKGAEASRLERHVRNIDIHVTLAGADIIGWHPHDLCTTHDGEFDSANDIGFYQDRATLWLPVPVGGFAIFFPEDAHAPLAGQGPIRKVVLKIADLPE